MAGRSGCWADVSLSQVLNVQVPFFFKDIIDALNVPVDPTTPNGVFVVAGTVIIGCEWRRGADDEQARLRVQR